MSASDDNLHIRNALIDNYNNYAQGLDSRNWELVRSCFADQVMIDYGSISAPSGDPKVPRISDEWMQILQGVIHSFDITRHAITNHRVVISKDEVSCRAYLSADHVRFPQPELPVIGPQDVVTVVGEYNNYYERIGEQWKIVRSELVVNWSAGNVGLFAQ